MRVLFIGGTGIISTACTELAAQRGIDLTLATRGRRSASLPAGVKTLTLDMDDAAGAAQVLGGACFDVVVDWIAFTPAHIERDLNLFQGRTGQYLFISSASAYQKPSGDYLITESTPLANPYWQYSRDKIACEDRLMRAYRECAGINRHVVGNERVLQERRERIHLGPESCSGHREVLVEA